MARLLLLSVIGAVLLWSNEPLSADSLYWAEQSGDIRSANLNGTNEKVVVSGLVVPTSLAIDGGAGKIYWTDQETGSIGSANLNGTHEQTLVMNNVPYGLALDISANKMYWTDSIGGGDHSLKFGRQRPTDCAERFEWSHSDHARRR